MGNNRAMKTPFTLEHVREHAISLMRQFGLRENEWSFQFMKAQTRFGECWFPGLYQGYIKLSSPICERATWEEIDDTIRHEIAHALAGEKAGHGPVWKEACKVTGAKPNRCGSSSIRSTGRWQGSCGCQTHYRFRRPHKAKIYNCLKCGETLEWRDTLLPA